MLSGSNSNSEVREKISRLCSTTHFLRKAHLEIDVMLPRIQEMYANVKCELKPCHVLSISMSIPRTLTSMTKGNVFSNMQARIEVEQTNSNAADIPDKVKQLRRSSNRAHQC